ncbi:MAG TPA: hypothetical protein DDW50_00010 [Firmicutes bacterium]|nr:hypothetical protein [Bacillota bacterium]
MNDALESKANLIRPGELSVPTETVATVPNLGLTTDSRGILMVRFTAGGNVKVGLFAIHGTDSLIKIAGDGMADQKDTASSYNAYFSEGAVTLQNTSSSDVSAKVTYFGA